MKKILTLSIVILLSACRHPMMVIPGNESVVNVEFINKTTGFTQHYYFDDPVACKKPSIVTALDRKQTKDVQLPVDKAITIWTTAWGLPAKAMHVSWCKPSAFTTKLKAGKTYRFEFVHDPLLSRCGMVLSSPDDHDVKQIRRRVDGPEIAGGPLTKDFSCEASDDLSVIK